MLEAAERATGWISERAIRVVDHGRAFVDPSGTMTKLGGQALAIVALLERRRVTGATDSDVLITDLAQFLLKMEMPDQPGRYFMAYTPSDDRFRLTPASEYYPGETLLALTRLAEHFPDSPYQEAARRAARYLVYERDGNQPALRAAPRDDHWLTISLSELYRLDSNPDNQLVAYLQAERMIANQVTAADGYPDRIGAARRDSGISYTSTATKGEALVAAWSLANHVGDSAAVEHISTAALRNAQFLMRVQYLPDNSQLFPRPDRLIGGWPGSATDQTIRVDYVQHIISVLVGVWCLVFEGDLRLQSGSG